MRVKDVDFSGSSITVRDGKSDVRTMIYTHVLDRGGMGVRNPLDFRDRRSSIDLSG